MTGTGAWGTPWFGLWRDLRIDRILKSDEQDYQLVSVNRTVTASVIRVKRVLSRRPPSRLIEFLWAIRRRSIRASDSLP